MGGEKYGGGDFENRRYLSDNGNILVCESTFHPREEGRDKATVTWRFLREGAIYGDAEKTVEFPNPFKGLGGGGKDKKKTGGEETSLPEPSVVVGDIMESVATSDEIEELSLTTNSADVVPTDVEEAIEEASWVPPSGERWAISAPGVDLSGRWKLIADERFRREYADFLRSLGQPLIVRGAAGLIVGNTREETVQGDGGRSLRVKGINAQGTWERTLVASGSDLDATLVPDGDGRYAHDRHPVVTADSPPERVEAESWWADGGRVHVSRTLGVRRYGGGSFESRRVLEGPDVYVCESAFHPDDGERRETSRLKWRFLREGATLFVGS